MSFSVYDSQVILCGLESFILYNYTTETEKLIELPKLVTEKNKIQHNNCDIETYHSLTSAVFSDDGQYFCICSNRKQLCLYKRENCSLISNKNLARAPSKVTFTPANDLVVADKSGDAYLFHTANEQSDDNGTLILGHLSMLLDLLVTYDNKFVITTDRDEKIRVSHFPNAYNIESYCLGHTAFVNNINLYQDNILVSAGGDGTFKFWDYKAGKELLSINFHDKLEKDDIKQLNQKLEDFDLTDSVSNLPVKHLRLMKINDTTSILILTFYNSNKFLIYQISGNTLDNLAAEFLQIFIADDEPLECLFINKTFWVLYEDGLKVYDFLNDNLSENVQINSKLDKLNKTWNSLEKKICKKEFYPTLYKRKLDNSKYNQERKKLRLSDSSK